MRCERSSLHGKEDIRFDTVSDPEIQDSRDAIVKVTSCAICGSDLHLFHNFVPAMLPGDIMGHEMMGGWSRWAPPCTAISRLAIVPWCRSPLSAASASSANVGTSRSVRKPIATKHNADKVFGHSTAGLFGYTHLTGGYPGGQAGYLRIPFADRTHIKVPDGLTDEQVPFLGDIFPTSWQAAVKCEIEETDTVVIWGFGPVGQMAIRSAVLLGARQVIAIDRLPERLSMAEAGGAITINFDQETVVGRLNDLTDGKGPEKCIDATGPESHVTFAQPDTIYDRAKQVMGLESDRPHVLREMIYVCSPAVFRDKQDNCGKVVLKP